jgi:hypothetical protein
MSLLFTWRNTKPIFYMRSSKEKGVMNYYLDEMRPRDLPDFRIASLDVVNLELSLAGISLPTGPTAGGAAMIDRHGQLYIGGFFGWQAGNSVPVYGAISMGEGYIMKTTSQSGVHKTLDPLGGTGNREFLNSDEIRTSLTDWCYFNFQTAFATGGIGARCPNNVTTVTYFYTPGYGVALYASYFEPFVLKQSTQEFLAWDYIDKLPGYTRSNLYQRLYPPVIDIGFQW